MFNSKGNSHAPDFLLIGSFVALLLLGLLFLSSAGAAVGFQKFNDSYYFMKHQLMNGILPGLGLTSSDSVSFFNIVNENFSISVFSCPC